MKLAPPATNPSRWQYRLWHAVTPVAYRVAAWCYRRQVRHTPPLPPGFTPGRPRVDTARQNARRRALVRLGRRHRVELESLIQAELRRTA